MKKTRLVHSLGIILLALSVFSSCSDSNNNPTGGGNPPAALTFDAYVGPLFQSKCGSASCHGATPGQSGFSILSYASVLAGGTNSGGNGIVANDTAASVVFQKLGSAPPFGGRMPQGGPFLPQSTLDSLAMWILAGAPQM